MAEFKIPQGYQRAQYQEFTTFTEGNDFLLRQCRTCTKYNSNCKMNLALREAMGENYPLWLKDFVKVEPQVFNPNDSSRVLCKKYHVKK